MMGIKHALIVDDSRSARVALRKLLEKRGISVDLAESGEEAINMLKSSAPDVVFMDHMMPGMDGFTATQTIRANPNLSEIPVVMCTSKEGNGYIKEAMAIGASAILIKPAPPSKLDELIKFLEATPQPTKAATTQHNALEEAMLASKDLAQQNSVPDFEKTQAPIVQKPIQVLAQQPSNANSITPEEVDTKIRLAFEKSLDFTKLQAIVQKFTNQLMQEEKEAMLADVHSSIKSFQEDFDQKNQDAIKQLDQNVPMIVDERMQSSFATQVGQAIEAKVPILQELVATQVRQELEQAIMDTLDERIRSIIREQISIYETQITEQLSEFEKYIDSRFTPDAMIGKLKEVIHEISSEISISVAEKESQRIAEDATKQLIENFKNRRKAEMKDAIDERLREKTKDFKFISQKYSAFAAGLGLAGALVFSIIFAIVF